MPNNDSDRIVMSDHLYVIPETVEIWEGLREEENSVTSKQLCFSDEYNDDKPLSFADVHGLSSGPPSKCPSSYVVVDSGIPFVLFSVFSVTTQVCFVVCPGALRNLCFVSGTEKEQPFSRPESLVIHFDP